MTVSDVRGGESISTWIRVRVRGGTMHINLAKGSSSSAGSGIMWGGECISTGIVSAVSTCTCVLLGWFRFRV